MDNILASIVLFVSLTSVGGVMGVLVMFSEEEMNIESGRSKIANFLIHMRVARGVNALLPASILLVLLFLVMPLTVVLAVNFGEPHNVVYLSLAIGLYPGKMLRKWCICGSKC